MACQVDRCDDNVVGGPIFDVVESLQRTYMREREDKIRKFEPHLVVHHLSGKLFDMGTSTIKYPVILPLRWEPTFRAVALGSRRERSVD